jgi:hypothetical protein
MTSLGILGNTIIGKILSRFEATFMDKRNQGVCRFRPVTTVQPQTRRRPPQGDVELRVWT